MVPSPACCLGSAPQIRNTVIFPLLPGKGKLLAEFEDCRGNLPLQSSNSASYSRPLGAGPGWGDQSRVYSEQLYPGTPSLFPKLNRGNY